MIDPNIKFPMANIERLCFLKNIITNPNIIVGDYTYYDDPDSVENFNHNVLYHFDFIGDKLIIGKFCQIATGVKFIMKCKRSRHESAYYLLPLIVKTIRGIGC